MLTLVWSIAVVIGLVALAYANAPGWSWVGAIALALGVAWAGHLVWLPLVIAAAAEG